MSPTERQLSAAAVWSTFSHPRSTGNTSIHYQYHILGVDVRPTAGTVTLLGELDKFVPLSSQRFSDVKNDLISIDGNARLQATVTGQPGEVVHVTALQPRGDSWVVLCQAYWCITSISQEITRNILA